MVDAGTSPNQNADTFLIEVMIGGKPNYLIAARLDGPDPIEAMNGVTKEQVEALFGRGTLRAAPLPPPGRPVLRTASAEQSMYGLDLSGGG